MTLQQMEYIVAVYRTRHFAKAAESCGVTQPTLSAMVQKMETELGIKIFERSSQKVTPTPIGKAVVEQAWKVLQRAKRIKDIVDEEKKSIQGTLRIGILPTIAPYLLPRFFSQMQDKYPELEMKVWELKTSEMKKAIDKGEIDVGIMVDIEGLDDYNITTLYYEQFMGYVAENDPIFEKPAIKLSDLQNEFLWLLDEGHCFRSQMVKFCQLKSASLSKATYSLGSIETFMRMVENGKGMTFIPELALTQLTEQQKRLVRPFAIPIPTREVVMAVQKSFIRLSVINQLAENIRGSVPECMLKYNNTEQRIL